jgi:hypothetical protein
MRGRKEKNADPSAGLPRERSRQAEASATGDGPPSRVVETGESRPPPPPVLVLYPYSTAGAVLPP